MSFLNCRPTARRSRMRDLISSAVRSALSNQRFHISYCIYRYISNQMIHNFTVHGFCIFDISSDIKTECIYNITNIFSLEDEAERFNNQVLIPQPSLHLANMNRVSMSKYKWLVLHNLTKQQQKRNVVSCGYHLQMFQLAIQCQCFPHILNIFAGFSFIDQSIHLDWLPGSSHTSLVTDGVDFCINSWLPGQEGEMMKINQCKEKTFL